MSLPYGPRFVETDEEKAFDASIPQHTPITPFPVMEEVIAPTKEPDPAFARFHRSLPNIAKLTRDILDDDLDYTKALVVESNVDQMVDWAPNVLVWCADNRFIGTKPFPRQAEMLVRLFEEWCPRCSNPRWFKEGFPTAATFEEVERNCAMLEFGVCPHCKFKKGDGRSENIFVDPYELVAVWGQRSGKSAVSSMGISYLTHMNCALHTPWKTYGLTPGQVLDFTMVATMVKQSKEALWSNFKKMMENSYWFKQYKTVCDEEGHKHGVRETVRANETSFNFKHKGISVQNASNDHNALRGSTRFGFAIDELAFFDGDATSGRTRRNGAETYTSLNNSLMTLRQVTEEMAAKNRNSTVPNPLGFCISSPRAMNDAIMQLYRDRQSDRQSITSHEPTWKINPRLPLKSKAMQKLLEQPNGHRDFGAKPPLTDDPLFTRIGVVTQAFETALSTSDYQHAIQPSIRALPDEHRIASGRAIITTVTAAIDETYKPTVVKPVSAAALAALGPYRTLFEDLLERPLHTRPHVLGLDVGKSNNAMCIAGLCLADNGEKVITDFLVEIKPDTRRHVNTAHVFEEVVIPLLDRLNVVGVFYDQWQSLHQIQHLTNLKGALGPQNSPSEYRKWRADLKKSDDLPPFLAERVFFTVAEANLLVARMEQGDLLFPATERSMYDLVNDKKLRADLYPYAHLALQMSTVRVHGNRLLKPTDRDDDLFRAWAHAAIPALKDEVVRNLLLGEGKKSAKNRGESAPLGYVAVARGGRGITRVMPLDTGSTQTFIRRSGGGGKK